MARILYTSPALAKEAIFRAYHALVLGGTGLIRVVSAPSTATSSGIIGQIAISGQYFYAVTGQNQWGRTLLTSL